VPIAPSRMSIFCCASDCMVITVGIYASQEVGWGAREETRCLIYLEYARVGVGTQLLQGCQDITGPFPSVLLDKASRIYAGTLINKVSLKLNLLYDI